MKTRSYWMRVREALSQLIGAFLGLPDPDRTLSFYAGKAQAEGRWWGLVVAPIINLIFRDKNHCESAFRNLV